METIRTYVDTMFRALPDSEQARKIKDDLLGTMEDKYNELKAEGRSENEAVGAVIADFGSIGELEETLGSVPAESVAAAVVAPVVTEEEAREYVKASRRHSLFVSLGVTLLVATVGITAAVSSIASLLGGTGNSITPIVFFLCIAAGVTLCVLGGVNYERYNHYENDRNRLSAETERSIRAELERYRVNFAAMLCTGIALFILAPVTTGLIDNLSSYKFGAFTFFGLVAAGVFLVVYSSMNKVSYEKLLNEGDYAGDDPLTGDEDSKNAKANKICEAVMGVIWPLTVAWYLFAGIRYGWWHPGWIVFPIVGLLSGAFDTIVHACCKD